MISECGAPVEKKQKIPEHIANLIDKQQTNDYQNQHVTSDPRIKRYLNNTNDNEPPVKCTKSSSTWTTSTRRVDDGDKSTHLKNWLYSPYWMSTHPLTSFVLLEREYAVQQHVKNKSLLVESAQFCKAHMEYENKFEGIKGHR